ncbi:MAG: VanZ family protein [Myxococcales bacterium]
MRAAPWRASGGIAGLLYWWGPVAGYAAAIFAFSALSQPPAGIPLPGGDKLVHFAEYLGFGVLFARAFHRAGEGATPRRAALLALVLGTLYGVSDELHQLYVPNRVADPFDLLADAAGAFAGGALFAGWSRRGETPQERS